MLNLEPKDKGKVNPPTLSGTLNLEPGTQLNDMNLELWKLGQGRRLSLELGKLYEEGMSYQVK